MFQIQGGVVLERVHSFCCLENVLCDEGDADLAVLARVQLA